MSNPVKLAAALLIGVVIGVVGFILFAGWWYHHNQARQHAAVYVALQQLGDDTRNRTVHRGRKVTIHYQELASDLNSVDIRSCPPDFQAAWIAYDQALNQPRHVTSAEFISSVLASGETGGITLLKLFGDCIDKNLESDEEIIRTSKALRLVSGKYGVRW